MALLWQEEGEEGGAGERSGGLGAGLGSGLGACVPVCSASLQPRSQPERYPVPSSWLGLSEGVQGGRKAAGSEEGLRGRLADKAGSLLGRGREAAGVPSLCALRSGPSLSGGHAPGLCPHEHPRRWHCVMSPGMAAGLRGVGSAGGVAAPSPHPGTQEPDLDLRTEPVSHLHSEHSGCEGTDAGGTSVSCQRFVLFCF